MTIPVAEQARALTTSAGVRVRDDLLVVRVEGEDRVSWLNGQVTNDVRVAKDKRAVYALAVTVRGKIMADLWVLDRGPELLVLVPELARAVLLESFERQIIMEDVTLTPDPATCVISVQGPRATQTLEGLPDLGPQTHAADELGTGGVFVLVQRSELPTRLSQIVGQAEQLGGCLLEPAGFELARLRAGRAWLGLDFDEHNYPQEAGLKARAVSFNKGCYLGQEVVCTLESRGRLTRRLVQLEAQGADAPVRGAELLDAEGRAIGQVRSVAIDPELGHALMLGYVKPAQSVLGTALRAGDCALTVRALVGAE